MLQVASGTYARVLNERGPAEAHQVALLEYDWRGTSYHNRLDAQLSALGVERHLTPVHQA